MKKISVLVLSSLALTAVAQNKIDFSGRMVIEDARDRIEAGANGGANIKSRAAETKYNVIVEFNDGNIDFGDVDVDFVTQIGDDMAIVGVTPAAMEQLAELPQVMRISLGNEVKPLMNAGRAATFVDDIHAGSGLDRAYTGKGVVAGLYDTGLDVNHINFKDAAGQPRTKALYVYNSGTPTRYTDATSISNFTTETTKETHGTHVLGIMAGGYKGSADFSYFGSNGRAALTLQGDAGSAIPYYGVAPDADLSVACGSLTTSYIVSGVQLISQYAKSKGQPCVINLSIGNNVGPHDGSDATSKALDEVGKNAIIFISAGNEGEDNISLNTTGESIKTFVAQDPWTANVANGTIDIWGADNQVYTVRVFAYNRGTGREIFSYTLDKNLAGSSVKQGDMEGWNSSMLSGTLTVSSNIDTGNNRYNVAIIPNVRSSNTQVVFGIAIEPKPGQTVDAFVRNLVFASFSQPGFIDGTPDNSINGMACGKNVVVVGSFSSSRSFPFINNNKASSTSYVGAADTGSRSNFSSYGWNTGTYEALPHVCAPGEVIVSSVSKYYMDTHADEMYSGLYTMPGDGLFIRNSTWAPMQGTSMASPFAAGVVALWLEADPTLTVSDVKDILAKTSTTDLMINSEIEKWGAGKINALEGIKEVLKRKSDGVNDVVTDVDKALVTTADGRNYEIFVAGAKKVEATVYSLAGLGVAGAAADNNTLTLDAGNVAPGVYVLGIVTDKGTETRKIMIK